jgi:Transposase and inactivated derivatives
MNHITGIVREQITLFPEAIEDYIADDNPVCFLDAYVDQLDISTIGFQYATVKETGRPPYNPKDILKLYLYGYLNRIRSSRLLERETKRNLEVFWLLKRLSPDHKTISNFRKENAHALRETFKQFVIICKKLELFGNELVAIDSTKFKASNSGNRIKNKEQLDKSITHINESIHQYLEQLDQADSLDNQTDVSLTKQQIQQKIASLAQYKQHLEQATEELTLNNQKHISLTDPDCRLLKHGGHIEPAYSLQTAVDAKHSLIVDYTLTHDAADYNHLASMATSAQHILEAENLTVVADTGYYDTVELKACEDHSITTFVPIPKAPSAKEQNSPTSDYTHDRFVYDGSSDTYRCPQGNTLLNSEVKLKKRGNRVVHVYRTDGCVSCQARTQCSTSQRGRHINRWEHEAVIDRLRERLKKHPEIMIKRKAIIEHIFGTIKQVWGYGALLLRRMKNVASEVALMTLTYNIRRVLNIIGTKSLILQLQHL